MPDFTVIDGGGTGRPPPEDLHQRRAAEAMRILVIELLRAVPRGDDPEKRVLKGPADLFDHLGDTTNHPAIIDSVVRGIHSNLTASETEYEYHYGIPDIIRAALQLTAEKSSDDEFANSRRVSAEKNCTG